MEMTTLQSTPSLSVEKCCNGADVERIFIERDVLWPEGVRREDKDPTLACICFDCGRSLEFRHIK